MLKNSCSQNFPDVYAKDSAYMSTNIVYIIIYSAAVPRESSNS